MAPSEIALWQSSMRVVHGPDWRALLYASAPAPDPKDVARAGASAASSVPGEATARVLRLLESPSRASDAGSDNTGVLTEGSW